MHLAPNGKRISTYTVMNETKVLAVSPEKEFPETHTGGRDPVVWFIDDVKLRGFLL